MTEDHSVSRRASLKTLGAAGAVLVFGTPLDAGASTSTQAAPTESVVDVAAGRMTKGHS